MVDCVALALLAALAGPGAARAAEDLSVEVERNGRSFSVRAGATLPASLTLVWEVLTDYEKLPQFVPGISRSVVRMRHGNRTLLEQDGEARFLVFAFPLQVRLEVQEYPHSAIVAHAVGGNLRRLDGRYELHLDGGSVRLGYQGEIEPDFGLPAIIGRLVVRSMVEEQFTALVAEIERRAALPR